MPASLKFIGLLFGLGLVGAFASGFVQHHQTASAARAAAEAMTGGHVDAGEQAITRYGCGACHMIPGITAAQGRAGPSLRGMGKRAVVGGKLVNEPANMISWIRTPQHVSPETAMPDQPITAQEARDMAAYLYTLR